MDTQPTSPLADWLDRLSRESWQLELIISGFAIFLLVGVYEPLRELGYGIERLDLARTVRTQLIIPYVILFAAWFILLINLCVHVLFRGLWISAIGLRSVSGEIDFDVLRLQPRFDRFLRRRVGSFDRYVDRLEKICSVLFAFTFLVLFMLLALLGMVLLISVVNLVVREWMGLGAHPVVSIVNLLLLLGGLLYCLDFVTLSGLKRVRWIAPVYYPVYRFYSLITFAPLYRSLYYNLIDHRFGRRIGFLLVPYILFLALASSVSYASGAYFPEFSNDARLDTQYYDDRRLADGDVPQRASIPSRFVDNGFLELFIPYDPNDDDAAIEFLAPELGKVGNRGFVMDGVISIGNLNRRANVDSLLHYMSALHRIYVDDSLYRQPTFHFYTHPGRKQDGLLTIIDVDFLVRGEHLLRIETAEVERDTLVWRAAARIPFWKE